VLAERGVWSPRDPACRCAAGSVEQGSHPQSHSARPNNDPTRGPSFALALGRVLGGGCSLLSVQIPDTLSGSLF
jgi:hypothetical protein